MQRPLLGILVSIYLASSNVVHCYRRYTFVYHDFTLPTEDSTQLLHDLIEYNVVRRGQATTYSLVHSDVHHDFVYLTRLDKKRLYKALRNYPAETPLTAECAAKIVAPLHRKCKTIVSNILHDMSKSSGVTVGKVLHDLGIDQSNKLR